MSHLRSIARHALSTALSDGAWGVGRLLLGPRAAVGMAGWLGFSFSFWFFFFLPKKKKNMGVGTGIGILVPTSSPAAFLLKIHLRWRAIREGLMQTSFVVDA